MVIAIDTVSKWPSSEPLIKLVLKNHEKNAKGGKFSPDLQGKSNALAIDGYFVYILFFKVKFTEFVKNCSSVNFEANKQVTNKQITAVSKWRLQDKQ